MNNDLLNQLENLIVVPHRELRSLIDDIIYRDLPLSHPDRKQQRDKFHWVLNHLYMHHFNHKQCAKNAYDKAGAKYIPKELGSKYMRQHVGDIWQDITKSLQKLHILETNGDFDKTNKTKPKKKGKKTDKCFCGNSKNHLGRPFSMCYRLAPKWQEDQHWKLGTTTTPNKLDPPNIRNTEGELHQSDISIDVSGAAKELKNLAKERGWSPLTHKIFARKVGLFNHTPMEDITCSTGRVFNKVNCLPSPIRAYVKIKGVQMVELDIKSCLPNIMYVYIDDPEEQKHWLSHIKAKRLYKFFAVQCGFITTECLNTFNTQKEKDKYVEESIDRAKSAVCCYLGGKRSQDAKKVDKVISKHFPILHKKIEEIEASSPNKGELSRRLQRIESLIVVTGMSEEPYTTISIHDGVGVALPHVEEAYNQLHKLFVEHVGCECVITGYAPKANDAAS